MVKADRYEDAIAIYKTGDFEEALQIFVPLAEGGDPRAQAKLAVMYYLGEGVKKDYITAYKWYHLSAYRFPDVYRRNLALRGRKATAFKLSKKELAEARRQAKIWRPKTNDVSTSGANRARSEAHKTINKR